MPIAKKPTDPDDEEPKQTDTFMDDALGSIRETFIEFERKRIVDRLCRGREKTRAIYGRCEGQKPFGHYDGEMAILGVIRALSDARMSTTQIAARLNLERRPTRSGKPWSGPVIAKILRREKRSEHN